MSSIKAQKVCGAVGGQIVSIHSEAENNLVARMIDEDYMLCNGINVPVAEAQQMDEIAKRPLFCTPKTQWLLLSFITGLHRKRDGRGGYVSTWEDGSQATFGNVPEHRGNDSKADYPWSAQGPSGTPNWDYSAEHAEECSQMWHPCGWWNDILCDGVNLAGVVCQKNAT
uniref:C-type lectin domain-containing protein n=1 Tax=Globodera rostochiensis TaxID=31243 RepID=A0A914HZZ0_GLORO